ncbi:hypothetical protein JQK62_24385, partial [Leptospira santarosai]|nr:hypothetical protein [Leptospira santarosai]
MTERYDFLLKHLEEIRIDLLDLVHAESPSLAKELVDITGDLLKDIIQNRLGGDYICTIHTQKEYGNHLQFEKTGSSKPRILFLSHFDTVWQKGDLPIYFEDHVLYGPG